jgi:predicted secreted protein
VYANDTSSNANSKSRQVVAWRVGQSLDVTTTNLGDFPKMVAAAQSLLSLNGLQFDLTPATSKKLDQQRIESAYQNLTERVAGIANVMGRNANEAVVESIEFEPGQGFVPQQRFATFAAKAAAPAPVEEPSFEPGETTQDLRLVGKIKFK